MQNPKLGDLSLQGTRKHPYPTKFRKSRKIMDSSCCPACSGHVSSQRVQPILISKTRFKLLATEKLSLFQVEHVFSKLTNKQSYANQTMERVPIDPSPRIKLFLNHHHHHHHHHHHLHQTISDLYEFIYGLFFSGAGCPRKGGSLNLPSISFWFPAKTLGPSLKSSSWNGCFRVGRG